MTKLNRVTGKVFGGDATATGDNPEIGQFGSALAGTYNGTTDVATIQNLPAWGQGWAGAVTPDTNFPALPEMTGFGKVLSYQDNYLLQSGMPEWDSGTIYYTNNFCRIGNVFYYSLTDENQGNDPTTDTTNWANYLTTFDIFGSNNTFTGLNNFTGGLQTNGIDAANVDASNFNSAGTTYLSGLGMPSGNVEALTLGASGSSYTAPANGWFVFNSLSSASQSEKGFFLKVPTGNLLWSYISTGSANLTSCINIPARKGDTIIVSYLNIRTDTACFIGFIYAEGTQ